MGVGQITSGALALGPGSSAAGGPGLSTGAAAHAYGGAPADASPPQQQLGARALAPAGPVEEPRSPGQAALQSVRAHARLKRLAAGGVPLPAGGARGGTSGGGLPGGVQGLGTAGVQQQRAARARRLGRQAARWGAATLLALAVRMLLLEPDGGDGGKGGGPQGLEQPGGGVDSEDVSSEEGEDAR